MPVFSYLWLLGRGQPSWSPSLGIYLRPTDVSLLPQKAKGNPAFKTAAAGHTCPEIALWRMDLNPFKTVATFFPLLGRRQALASHCVTGPQPCRQDKTGGGCADMSWRFGSSEHPQALPQRWSVPRWGPVSKKP